MHQMAEIESRLKGIHPRSMLGSVLQGSEIVGIRKNGVVIIGLRWCDTFKAEMFEDMRYRGILERDLGAVLHMPVEIVSATGRHLQDDNHASDCST